MPDLADMAPLCPGQALAWTPAQVEFLRLRWSERATAAQIAEELGHGATRSAVLGKAHRLGLEERQTKGPRAGAGTLARAKAAPIPKLQPVRPQPAPQPIVVVPPRQIRCEAAPKGGVAIHDLQPHHCRWPVEGVGIGMRYCGAARVEGKAFAYCAEHYGVAAVPMAASRVEREVRAAMGRVR